MNDHLSETEIIKGLEHDLNQIDVSLRNCTNDHERKRLSRAKRQILLELEYWAEE